MNAQRNPGRCLAAGVSAATLALVLAVLPAGPAGAAPASPDRPLEVSISALWQRVTGWMRVAAEPDRPPGATRSAGDLAAQELDPEGTARPGDDATSSYGRAEGEDSFKLDPCG